MKPLTNDEFGKVVMDLASPERPFVPKAIYDPDGDFVEFVIKPDNFYAERVDDLLTVYRNEETGELVGSYIKSVSSLCRAIKEKYPGFAVIVEKPPVRLSHIFIASLLHLPAEPHKLELVGRVYRELIDEADEKEAEIDANLCAM
jgi:hypothetical protein